LRTTSATYRSVVWIGEQKGYRVTLLVGVAFLAFLMLAVSPFLLANDASAFGRYPAGAKIAGVSVGRMTKDAAIAKCREQLAGLAAEPVTLKIDNENYVIPATGFGLKLDYQRMADEAYNRSWHVSIVERMIRRFLRKPRTVDMPVIVKYDRVKLAQFINGAMPSINCKMRNAFLDVSSGRAVILSARDGREADRNQVLLATERALIAGKKVATVRLVKRTPAKDTKVNVDKLILVNLHDHVLSLYDRDKLLAQYPVATGSKKWPTCIGQWKVVKAEKNPTWYNRGSTWAENMPPMLPPGPDNPLGTRAITINGGGVLIHGTNDTGSIGYSASHGCVRMRIPDVEALYEHVTVGMPVYIIRESGNPGFDCSKKPFWWGAE
jgi:hypothetical protein